MNSSRALDFGKKMLSYVIPHLEEKWLEYFMASALLTSIANFPELIENLGIKTPAELTGIIGALKMPVTTMAGLTLFCSLVGSISAKIRSIDSDYKEK